MFLKLAVIIAALGTLATGGYFVVKEEGARKLSEALNERFQSGDYLAALAVAGRIKDAGRMTPEQEETTTYAARFLLAEDALAKAKQAAAEERWHDARALLYESEAVKNPAFQYYREARELLERAEAIAAGKAHETAVKIETLEDEAEREKKRRTEAEQRGRTLEKTLEQTIQEKDSAITQTRAEAAAAAEALRKSQMEAEARQAALAAEQVRTKTLMEQVEKESRQKFIAELRAYRDLAQRGKEQLEGAVSEIAARRDVTALIYLSQGKVLLEEAKSKTTDLRGSRTPAAYQGIVDDLVRAVEQFLAAGRQLRNATVYLENEGSAEFTGSVEGGKNTLGSATALLSGVSEFITSLNQ